MFTKVTFENVNKKPTFYLKIGQQYAFFKENIHISKRTFIQNKINVFDYKFAKT